MCSITQMANVSDLQFLLKITGVNQLKVTKCKGCDLPLVRPAIADDSKDAEHVGLYHYYQWIMCERCRKLGCVDNCIKLGECQQLN